MNHITREKHLMPEINFLILEISNNFVQVYINFFFAEIDDFTKFAKKSKDDSGWIKLVQNTFNPHFEVLRPNHVGPITKNYYTYSRHTNIFHRVVQ